MLNSSAKRDSSIYLANCSLQKLVSFAMMHQIKQHAPCHWEKRLGNQLVPSRKAFKIDFSPRKIGNIDVGDRC